jgi:polysaccharide biosynthesis transport protein
MSHKHLPMIRNQAELAAVTASASAAPQVFQHNGHPKSSMTAEPESGPDWRRVASALLRFKWLIVLAVVLGVGAAFGATKLLRPVYKAQANVWVDVPDRGGVDRSTEARGPIRQGALLEADDWLELLRSYVVLDQVVRDQRLYLIIERVGDRPSFTTFFATDAFRPGEYELTVNDTGTEYTLLNARDRMELERGTVGDSVGRRLGFRWAPASLPRGRTLKFLLVAPRDAATQLGQQLQTRMDLNGNFLAIELTGTNPAGIAKVLNAVTERYVAVAAQLKREKLTELTKILEDQLSTAQSNLDDAETALQRFRTRTITLPSDQAGGAAGGGRAGETRDPVRGDYFDMQADRDQLRRDREAIERFVTQQPEALTSIESVRQSPELSNALKELSDKQAQLRAYRYQYADEYPPVQRLIGEIGELQQQTIPTLARGLAAQLAARESELSRQANSASADLRGIPARTIEDVRLRRNAQLKEQTYTALQERYDQARLAAEATVPDVRVLDPAVVPQRPIKNTARRLLMMGLIAGIAIGVVGALVLDRMDPKVRYPEQVSRDLGLPILGVVPHLRSKEPAEVVEAMRGVRLNVIHEYGPAQPLLLTITSPGPGDGKSFLSANLALAFAEGGHRTLLIDGDARRGQQHRRFKTNRQPGLVDLLMGQATSEQILQATAYPRLHLIGCGTRTQRAPEVLGSPAMGGLVEQLRPEFDAIIIDSPPLTAGVDPFVLATLTGALLVVLRTGHSNREIAGAKLEVLDRLPIRLLGAVMNDVPKGAAYGYYAYSYYLPGYESAEERDSREAAGPLVI